MEAYDFDRRGKGVLLVVISLLFLMYVAKIACGAFYKPQETQPYRIGDVAKKTKKKMVRGMCVQLLP